MDEKTKKLFQLMLPMLQDLLIKSYDFRTKEGKAAKRNLQIFIEELKRIEPELYED